MVRHKLIGLLLIGLFVFALVACGTESAVTPDQTESISSTDVSNENKVADSHQNAERVLNVAMTFLDEPPDPYQAGWLAVPTGLAETLFKQDENLNTVPWLATAGVQAEPQVWEISLQ